ncbi:MAG: DUF302 domain-containing protein [Pseudomonadota bacterium]
MRFLIPALLVVWGFAAQAEDMAPREGWVVLPSAKTYEALVADVRAAAKSHKMGVVTQAGPTKAAKARGIAIPGNRVIGVFNNRFAVRILGHSTPAMIEAPIRIYVTENADGSATLSYKTPSFVFAPYMGGADPDFAAAAAELDEIFLSIAEEAVQ